MVRRIGVWFQSATMLHLCTYPVPRVQQLHPLMAHKVLWCSGEFSRRCICVMGRQARAAHRCYCTTGVACTPTEAHWCN